MNSFADFADAMAKPQRPSAAPARTFQRVAVLGGGADARMLAAIAVSEGADVTLFSAYRDELQAMRSGGIALRGAGPVGSYQADANGAPSVKTTAELDGAVGEAELIFLTGPIHKQRTYAMVLADHLKDGQVIVIAPGRTFGALETRWLLGIGGCTANITIVEAALPFWFTAEGNTLHLSPATGATGATLPGNQPGVCEGLHPLMPGVAPLLNSITSSFADGSGLVEVPALLLGGRAMAAGGPAIPMGATSLPENETFRNLIGDDHRRVVDDMAAERHETARRFGVRDLPGTDGWLDAHAGAASGEGARPIPSHDLAQRIVRDAVIGSLLPLTSAARLVGFATPATDAMIALASSILKADLATAGRKLPSMGVDGPDPDSARRTLENAAGL